MYNHLRGKLVHDTKQGLPLEQVCVIAVEASLRLVINVLWPKHKSKAVRHFIGG